MSPIVLDGVFGTGFEGELPPHVGALFEAVHKTKKIRIAIDVPSGLNASTGQIATNTFQADYTLTIDMPKRGFFFQDGWNVVGTVECLSIDLESYATGKEELVCVEESDVTSLFPPLVRNRHKYQAGSVVALAGSHGMPGAALLSSFAALRAGAGIVHLLYPEQYLAELGGVPFEVVRVPYDPASDSNFIKEKIHKASACLVGPGLGTSINVETLLKSLLVDLRNKPVVIDADALNWIGKTWGAKPIPYASQLGPLPQAILTPHIGEMKRLLGSVAKEAEGKGGGITFQFLQDCKNFVLKNHTNLILKGGPSFLLSHDFPPAVLLKGNPGMATAGAGDVLSGILAALLAQGLSARYAMLLGAYVHALAGDIAAEEETPYCVVASSILQYLPKAFKTLLKS